MDIANPFKPVKLFDQLSLLFCIINIYIIAMTTYGLVNQNKEEIKCFITGYSVTI